MTVLAPPRPPDSRDVEFTVEPDRGGQALIEEAKQHARRRRRRAAIAVIVAGLVGVAAVTAAVVAGAENTPPAREQSSIDADAPAPAAAAADAQPVELVASWGDVPEAWVMVFSDGRVLRGGLRGGLVREGWLSPAGLSLIERGRLSAQDAWYLAFVDGPADSAEFAEHPASDPRQVWASYGAGQYVPSEFAACPFDDAGWRYAADFLDRVPAAARLILAGTQRIIPIATPAGTGPAPRVTEHECFALNAAQVSAIAKLSDQPLEGYFDQIINLYAQPIALGIPKLDVTPVLPDGSVVHWGG